MAIKAIANTDWNTETTWTDSVIPTTEGADLNGKAVTLAGTTPQCLSLVDTAVVKGSLTLGNSAILNCTTITDAHIHVAGTACTINAVTINISATATGIIIENAKSVTGYGNIEVTGNTTTAIIINGIVIDWTGNINAETTGESSTTVALNMAGTITDWHGNITTTGPCTGMAISDGTITDWNGNIVTNSLGNGIYGNGGTITAWHGDITNLGVGSGVVSTALTITAWYGDITNSGSGCGVNTGYRITSWYGDIVNSGTGIGLNVEPMTDETFEIVTTVLNWYGDATSSGGTTTGKAINVAATAVFGTWYGDLFCTGLDAGIVIVAGATFTNWYGNASWITILNTNPCDPGYVTVGGTLSNWYGDLYLRNNAGVGDGNAKGLYILAGGQVTNWYGNAISAGDSEVMLVYIVGTLSNFVGDLTTTSDSDWCAPLYVDTTGIINSWIGDLYVLGQSSATNTGIVKSWIGDMTNGGIVRNPEGGAPLEAWWLYDGVGIVNSWIHSSTGNPDNIVEDAQFISIKTDTTGLIDSLYYKLPVIPPHIVASDKIRYEIERYQNAPTSMDGTLLSLDPLEANVLDTAENYKINSVTKIPALDSTKVIDPIGTLPKASVIKSSGGTLSTNYAY